MNSIKTVIVTGAAKGIGKAICERLLNDGFLVIAVDVDEHAGAELLSLLRGKAIEFIKANISNETEVQHLFTSVIQKHQHIDAVVNNAGIIRDNMIWKMSVEDFDTVINVNLKGTWLMCREAAIAMKEQQSGRIVNIASRAWLGNRGQSNYSASKAGVVALTRVLGLELGKYNVSVNAVAPGLIDTPLTQKLEPIVLQKLIDTQPSKSMGTPADVAKAVSFLVNADTQFITGQTIYVDGGKSIGANM